MAIYTKTGDKGETGLANGQRISKADARIEAYGTVDELNSWIGLLRAGVTVSGERLAVSGEGLAVSGERLAVSGERLAVSGEKLTVSGEQLAWIQNRLFNLGAALSLAPGEWIGEADVKQLEAWIDAMQAEVPPMRAFILPAGNETMARCHVSRTICRRAERRMIALGCDDIAMQFMNRLSDYLFVLARYVGHTENVPEEAWKKE